MKPRTKEIPRMLPFVLQAVSDLKDVPGSTVRKILEQVHTAIDISDLKPKPRNVVMQVKKALRHAVENGVLNHKAGKYKLSFDLNPTPKPKSCCNRCKKGKTEKRGRPSRRRRSRHRRRRVVTFKYSPSPMSDGSSYASRRSTSTADSYETMKSRSRRRHRRSMAKRTVQFRKSVTRRRSNRRGPRRVRRGTPMPKTGKEEQKEEANTVNKEMEKKLEKVFSNCQANEQGDNNPSAAPDQATLVELPRECCDNPECLCNLKQEPSEDTSYENPNDMTYM